MQAIEVGNREHLLELRRTLSGAKSGAAIFYSTAAFLVKVDARIYMAVDESMSNLRENVIFFMNGFLDEIRHG